METTLIPIGKKERKLVKIAAAQAEIPVYEFLSKLVNDALLTKKKK